MDPVAMAVLALVGLAGGFMAGLLGLGGGVIIIPLLIYVGGLPVRLATGISMVQAFFATASGVLVHRRNRTLDLRLGVALGISGTVGSLIGSFGSSALAAETLLAVYSALVVLSIVLMFFAPRTEKSDHTSVNLLLAVAMGLPVGVLAGMLGVGGGFIMTPLMISVLRIPTRVAVGTSLLMIIPATLAGSIGKVATGQFALEPALPVIIGSIIGAQAGGRVNKLVSPRTIRFSLLTLLLVILVRTGVDLFA